MYHPNLHTYRSQKLFAYCQKEGILRTIVQIDCNADRVAVPIINTNYSLFEGGVPDSYLSYTVIYYKKRFFLSWDDTIVIYEEES